MSRYGQQAWGSVELGSEVNISVDNNSFDFNVDGSSFSLAIPPGKYNTSRERHESELVEVMTKTAANLNLPVQFKLGGMHYDQKYNVLIVEHLDNRQEHVLDGFKGNAADLLFGGVRFNLLPRD
jgi:hypothetical protein